ncbi:hypothetical protein PYK79_23145 [Streptomyces sp. ID05-04B]|uniref:hypothetical protein n=1 Tax=Streptomyces sp. ID05-04B TaxID=3028661 RepID=UPI0029C26633|nr:hypothetical protein [Streptomyces sp. ID05-04B]MDX5565639.1 hypothetical protein [Streptomyces sp. ID05-04B]
MSDRPKVLSVRMTDGFAEDLEVLQRGGVNASDAVRLAVRLIAQAHRHVDEVAQASSGRRPASISLRTAALYPAPYDGPEQGV